MLERIAAAVFIALWLVIVAAALADAYGQTQVEMPGARPSVGAVNAGRNVVISCQGPASNQLCFVTAALSELPTGARPACNAVTRRSLWFSDGAAGVADRVEACAKNADGTFTWRQL